MKLGLIVAAFMATALAFAAPARAAPILPANYTVNGVFDDGGILSGTFGLNVYGYLTNFDFTTTAGTALPGRHYNNLTVGDYSSNSLTLVDVQPGYFNTLQLDFASPLNNFVGIDLFKTGLTESFECGSSWNCYLGGSGPNLRHFLSGGATVAAVPEPITLSLFGMGLAGAIGARRRRNNNVDERRRFNDNGTSR